MLYAMMVFVSRRIQACCQSQVKTSVNSYWKKNLLPLPGEFPCYPPEALSRVISCVMTCGESGGEVRICRDFTLWIVPSPENLYFGGQKSLECVGEDMFTPWTKCMPMGSPLPLEMILPVLTIGLLPDVAFTEAEQEKLQNYGSLETPYCFTPRAAFPLLIVEVKAADTELIETNAQNLHNGSLSVKDIMSLYQTAFPNQTLDLYGQVLVFSICHNLERASIWGSFCYAC